VRILFLSPASVLGGAERSLLDLMASLRQAEAAAELLLAAPSAGPLTAEAERLGVGLSVMPMPRALARLGDSGLAGRGRAALALLRHGLPAAWAGWGYVRRLRGLIRALRPDVIHTNGMKFHLLAALARDGGDFPPVVWHLRDFVGRRRLMSRLLGRAASRSAGAVAISHAVAEDARRVLPGLPVAVVPNAIDTDHFAPGPGDGTELDRLAGLAPAAPGTVRVGLVATFARWKGHDVFLRAARHVVDQRPGLEVRFYVVGGPIYETGGSQWSDAELRALGAELLTAGRLGFVGFRPEMPAAYRALDVVVHASTQPEPFGRTIVEAMACGRATVVAQAGGAAELFTPGENAVGVPPGDADALAAAVADLAGDPAWRRRLGERGRLTAAARFGRARLGPQLLAAYRQFGMAGHAAPTAPVREAVS
jgi:glycosyltransferase involved in cell wall biosynthesis